MGEDYKIMGGQGWPWMTENQIGPSMGYRTPLARHHPEWGAVGQSSGQDGYVRAEALVDELLDLDRSALKHVPSCLPLPGPFCVDGLWVLAGKRSARSSVGCDGGRGSHEAEAAG